MAEEALANARFTTASGFARCDCPFCLVLRGRTDKKQSLAVSTTTGWYKCWKCATSGKLNSRDSDDIGTEQRVATTDMAAPEGYLPLSMEPARSAASAQPARDYLRGRGLGDEAMWRETGIGCCLSGRWSDRIVVPVLSPAGGWWGWVSRLWSKVPDPYRNAPGMVLEDGVFNHAALLVETDEPVMVVEGCFDALPYWPNAVALLGKPKAPQIDSLVGARRPVVVVLDGDSWEEGLALSMDLELMGQRTGYVRLPPKEDPNSVDPTWVRAEVQRCL